METALDQLKVLGAKLVPVRVPDVSEIREVWKTICTFEAARAHSTTYPARASDYGNFFGDFLEYGRNINQRTYQHASRKREQFSSRFLSVFNGIDMLACPGAGIPCKIPVDLLYKSLNDIRSYLNPYTYFQFTIPANFAGLPSLSLPCGISPQGPPYTLQLVGPRLSEVILCRVGNAYQQVTQWHKQFPPL